MSSDVDRQGPRDAAPSTSPPEGNPWGRFFARMMLILVRPTKAWDRLAKEEVGIGELLWPHALVLILARGCAELVGHLLEGWKLGAALADLAFGVLSWFVLVWVFSFVAGSVASTRGGARLAAGDAMRFGAYGLTPLFAVGMISVIPFPYVSQIAGVLAMPYAFYVLAVGVRPMLHVDDKDAAAVTGLVCGALVLAWALLPNLIGLILRAIGT